MPTRSAALGRDVLDELEAHAARVDRAVSEQLGAAVDRGAVADALAVRGSSSSGVELVARQFVGSERLCFFLRCLAEADSWATPTDA